MKTKIIIAAVVGLPLAVFHPQSAMSQVGINTVTPDPSSILDMVSTNQGMLVSRMTAAQRDAIASPARGLMVFVTTDSAFYYNNGAPASPNWVRFMAGSGSSGGWALTGNAGTDSSTNFLGTTDLKPLRIMTNNTQRVIVNSNGDVGIGTTSAVGLLNLSKDGQCIINVDAYGISTVSSIFRSRRAEGNASAPSAILSGDELVYSPWSQGYSGLGFSTVGYILFSAAENFSGTQLGTRVRFAAVPGGQSKTAVENFIEYTTTGNLALVQSSGNVGIGTTAPIGVLSVEKSNYNDTLLYISNDLDATKDSTLVMLRNGNVGIGTTSPGAAKLNVVGADGVYSIVDIRQSGAGDNNYLRFLRTRGTSAAPSAVQSGDPLGFLAAQGYGTNGYQAYAGYIRFQADETFTDIANGGNIAFFTTPNGTLATAERMRIANSGNVGIGTTNPGGGTGSSVLSIANTAAPTALAGVTHLYSSGGEGYWMDAAGNATLQTPHDHETGEWIFFSKNIKTGRVVKINMEKLVRKFEELTGEKFMQEWQEGEEEEK